MNNLGLTDEQVQECLYGESVYDENNNILYEVIATEVTDTDQEKGRVDYDVIIKDAKTGKFYKARLSKSPWIHQEESNAGQPWKEVFPKQKTITVYE